tara:strand:- start:176 stop:430 length:255 start_codon:yes stop_codon:yes gene_type:complete
LSKKNRKKKGRREEKVNFIMHHNVCLLYINDEFTTFENKIKMDEEEVVAIRTSTIEDILAEMEKSPETFTHWLLEQKDILKGLE